MSTRSEDEGGSAPLSLPYVESATEVSSEEPRLDPNTENTLKFNELGPIVVNRDGTLSRIPNWHDMSDIEKQRTMKLLAKRNKERTDQLRADNDQQQRGEQ